MSTVTDITAKPAEEFVVFGEEPLPEDHKTSGNPESSLSLDTSISPHPQVNRTDSFPRTLPLPASSVLSPTSAPSEKDLPAPVSKQEAPPPTAIDDIVSPPEPETVASRMFVQTANIAAPFGETDGRASTPLAELAGTAFDHAVAVRRRGASIGGEEISEDLEDLKVEDSSAPTEEKTQPVKEIFTEEQLKARKDDPAVLAALPQIPSAEDYEVAKSHEGARFNPEYPTETKVAS